ncbi:alpha/beta hydrolase [Variovorax paradoxus]|uniref:alpha/beta hydrolase n=1 Tax=Variovorax paradoxus TaxID=34073 RepID=UPI00399BB396
MSLQTEGPNHAGDTEYQYVSGQFRGSFASLFSRFDALNVQALTSNCWQLDLRYGPHERQTLDLCPAVGVARGTAFYFHAGYWHSRDKAQFRFLAPPLADAGFNVAMVNYPLSPEVRIPQITEAVRAAVPALIATLPDRHKSLPLFLCGHSAGAHLAIELAANTCSAWQSQVSAVICISGLFDLVPLVNTSLNQKLVLDHLDAHDCSPLYRVRSNELPEGYFLVGGDETPAFQDQSRAMAQHWASAGNRSRLIAVAGQDHFSVLDALQGPDGLLLALMNERSTGC